MMAQDIFDQVVRHLGSLPRRATANGRCLYRTPDGLRCAIGCLLTEGEIDRAVELLPMDHLGDIRNMAKLGVFPERLAGHATLLEQLQHVHDNPVNWSRSGPAVPDRMSEALERLAQVHTIDPSVIRKTFGRA